MDAIGIRKRAASIALTVILALSVYAAVPMVPANAIDEFEVSANHNRASDDKPQEAKYTIKFLPEIKFAVKVIHIEFPDGYDLSGAKLADVTNIPRTARIFYPLGVPDATPGLKFATFDDDDAGDDDTIDNSVTDGDPKSITVVLAKPTILRTNRLITLNFGGIVHEDIRPYNEKTYDDCDRDPGEYVHSKAKVPHEADFDCFRITTYDRFLTEIEDAEYFGFQVAYPNVIMGQIDVSGAENADATIFESASSPASPPSEGFDLTIDKERVLTEELIGPRTSATRTAPCDEDTDGTGGCIRIDNDEIEANNDDDGTVALTIETVYGKMLIKTATATTDPTKALMTFEVEGGGDFDDDTIIYKFIRDAGTTVDLLTIEDDGDTTIRGDLTLKGDSEGDDGGDLFLEGSTVEFGSDSGEPIVVARDTTLFGEPILTVDHGMKIEDITIAAPLLGITGVAANPSMVSVTGAAVTSVLSVTGVSGIGGVLSVTGAPIAFKVSGVSTLSGATTVQGALHVTGALTVAGAKLAVVDIVGNEGKGLFARESPEGKFVDEGIAACSTMGGCASVTVPVESTFDSNTLDDDTSTPYIIHLTPYGAEDLYVSSVTDDDFTVASLDGSMANGFKFAWMLSAYRGDAAFEFQGDRFPTIELPETPDSVSLADICDAIDDAETAGTLTATQAAAARTEQGCP